MTEVAAKKRVALSWSAVFVWLLVVLYGCVTQTTESRRMLGDSGYGRGEPPVVIPNCELGQALSQEGCRDIIVGDDSGGKTNLRKAFATSRCRSVYDRLRFAYQRTREYLRQPRHDLREALLRVEAECRLREEHIEACRSSGFFEGVGGEAGLLHFVEGQTACYELADLYRHRLANGYQRTP